MSSSKVKALVVVFVLLVCTSLVTVGCKGQENAKGGLVNTKTLPGQKFKSHRNNAKAHRTNPNIVYLGSSSSSDSSGFGPGEVSFDFRSLR